MSGATQRLGAQEAGAPTRSVDHGILGSLVSHAVARANLAGDAAFHALIDDRSITPQRFWLLELVGANPGLQQVQLADALAFSRSAVTLVIDYWQARGCVERRADPADRRPSRIFLTTEGASLLAELQTRVLAQDARLCAELTRAECRELARLLAKLRSNE